MLSRLETRAKELIASERKRDKENSGSEMKVNEGSKLGSKIFGCPPFGCRDQKNYAQSDPKDDELFAHKAKAGENLVEACMSSNVQIDLQMCE